MRIFPIADLLLVIWFHCFLLLNISHALHAEATSFIFNGFDNTKDLNLTGIAELTGGFIRLTNTSSRLFGRAFYSSPIRMKAASTNVVSSFSTTFVFCITPLLPTFGGHGMAFLMSPTLDSTGIFPSQYLGMMNATDNGNSSNHVFGVEFDTVQDLEFSDINDNHVGINLDSMISTNSSVAGYWSPQNASQNLTVINLKSGNNIQAWIDYNGQAQQLNVSIAPVSQPQPHVPLLSIHVNLSNILKNYMYVGFSASTGVISGTHRVLSWSFSNNGTAEALDLSKLPVLFPSPSFESSTRFKVMVSSIVLASLLVLGSLMGFVLYKRSHREVVESWELEFGLHRYSYKELVVATKNFHEGELLGVGGFGRVYKGVLPKSQLGVAVKRLSSNSDQGEREFIAEMSSMGQLHHQNLVALLGWSRCKGELLLVYEYMPNGSLDKLIFGKSGKVLRWEQRLRIVEGIAAGVLYLHEGWERQILHRDIKASNVLLDADMNAKLGDFGLARLYEHGQNPHTTKVVGTLGYMAPEFARTGKATPSTDVYSFGILLLEVMTARRPFEVHGPHHPDFLLVEGLWELYMNEKLLEAADKKLEGLFNPKEMEKILMLGLFCTHPDPSVRPTMQQVLQTLRGHEHLPSLPPFQANLSSSGLIRDVGELISFSSTSIKSWSTADMTTQITGR